MNLEGLSHHTYSNPPPMMPPNLQPSMYNPHNTPVGLPPPTFNPMMQRMPMMHGGPPMNHVMNMNPHLAGGVGMHNLPPPTAFQSDPFAKQSNLIEAVLIPENTFLSTHSKHDITLKVCSFFCF